MPLRAALLAEPGPCYNFCNIQQDAKMTILFRIDPEINIVYYAGFGLCTGQELLKVEREAFQHELRRPRMKILLDMERARLDFEVSDIYQIVAMNKELASTGYELEQTAVVSHNLFISTIGEIGLLLAGDLPIQLRVFTILPDALAWLEMSEAQAQIIEIRSSLERDYRERFPGRI